MKKSKDWALVTIQFVLFVIYFLWSYPLFQPHFLLKWISIVIAATGIAITLLALLQLNTNLSPFPTPKTDSSLILSGLYAVVRHPIYLGIIIFAIGFGWYAGDGYKIGIGILLWILFEYKAAYEEEMLAEKFSDYKEYTQRTSKIIPGFRRGLF